MKGHVDSGGRALMPVELQKPDGSAPIRIDVWIDTGFTGDLVIPARVIESMGLEESGSVDAVLADGSQIGLSTYSCIIEWFGRRKTLEVVANEGESPLLGVGLLLGLELRVDYRNLRLELMPAGSATAQ